MENQLVASQVATSYLDCTTLLLHNLNLTCNGYYTVCPKGQVKIYFVITRARNTLKHKRGGIFSPRLGHFDYFPNYFKIIPQKSCFSDRHVQSKDSVQSTTFFMFFSRGTRAQHLTLCGVWCVVCVCVVFPGWMRCSERLERKDNCTVTVSVYSTYVHTAVGTTES